jgi:hypothetical protein
VTPLELLRAAARSRPARRLAFAIIALVIVDRVEPAMLRSVEEARYEDPARDFRFENSDLFALGPLVAYLRERPQGQRPRVLFLGNSITFGYGLNAADALPGRYQRLDPSAKVFNVGINGLPMVSSLLVARAAIDSVDLAYALLGPIEAPIVDPILPRLIPVEDADLARLHLAAPNDAERRLSTAANHWRLYRDAYRVQAALFGSSTRQYIYLHKGALARALIARVRAEQPAGGAAAATVTIDAPMSDALPDAARQLVLRQDRPELWQFGDLARDRRKPIVLLQQAGYSRELANAAIGDFNRAFAPYARVFVVHVPPPLTIDGMHLTGAAATQLARLLWDARAEEQRR